MRSTLVGTLVGLLVMTMAPAWALADGVAVLTDPSVAPYAETVAALRAAADGLSVVEYDVHRPDAVSAIITASPSVIVAVGQQALQLLAHAAGSTPVVYASVLAPQQYGLPATFVGVPLEADPAALISALHSAAASRRRVGIVYNPATFASYVDAARIAAASAGASLVEQRVTSVHDVQAAVDAVAGNVDAILLVPDPALWSRETISYVLLLGLQRGIAVAGFLDSLTQAGALLSVSPDYRSIGTRAAGIVRQLVARRAVSPALQYDGGHVTLNLATAARLHVVIAPDLEQRAFRVFR